MKKHVIVIHGGAGTILKKNLSPEMEDAYHQKLSEALLAGNEVLKNGGSSVDAVVAAITVMEDSPLFNAGKGSVFTHDGKNEMDASIMNGKDLKAGAISGATHIKNPIVACKEIMNNSEHVMLSGAGAEAFAKERGITLVDPNYFRDERRWQQLLHAQKQDSVILDHDGEQGKNPSTVSDVECDGTPKSDDKFGTVGCVALDQHGNLAAGTSTGGMTNKRYGRIGDSPLLGAGTYADNRTCAVSCTGHGEYFIRLAVAKEISAQMEHGGLSVSEAAENVIHTKLTEMGGSGGVICLDAQGTIAMPFNTAGMYRGYVNGDGEMEVLIFKGG